VDDISPFDILLTQNLPVYQRWVWGDTAHWLYLAVGLAVIVGVLIWLRRLPEPTANRAIVWLAVANFLVWIVPPALQCVTDTGERWIDHLPLHLCTSSAVIIPIALMTRAPLLLNYCYGLAMPGAVAALLFPGEVFRRLSDLSIHYFFHNVGHWLPIIAAIAPIVLGWWHPSWRYFPSTFGIGLAIGTIAYGANKLIGSNYFFVNWPERGTILEGFADLFGPAWYLPVLGAIGALVIAAMFGLWSLIGQLARLSDVLKRGSTPPPTVGGALAKAA
jgi:uncharacterized membrane protein YwaF